jgi:heat shock protein HtpX
MAFMKRIGLFLLTNLLVMVTIGIVWSIVSHFLGLAGLNSQIPFLMAFCAVWGMGGAFIALLMSKWSAKMFHGVKIIDANTTNAEHRALLNKVHDFARRAQLPKMPEVGIYDSADINAFATGPSKKNSLVAVSTGLLQRMNEAEVDGVLAHEVAHIANGDMVTLTLVQGLVNSFVLFFAKIVGFIAGQAVEENKRFMVEIVVSIAAQILFGILGTMVVARFSRAREFRADTGGARLAGRDRMIAALSALQRNVESIDPHTPEAVAAFKISSRPSGFMALFSTHPPLEDRIRALQTQNI